jgi:hypothetical protein
MSVSPVRVKDAAATPPKRTAVAAVKPVPRISTVPPSGALVGAKLAITGGAARNELLPISWTEKWVKVSGFQGLLTMRWLAAAAKKISFVRTIC